MKVYALKTCDTCRKALKAIAAAGHVPEVVDVRDDGLSAEAIGAILTAFGDKAINRASTTWRGLGEETRAQPAAALLAIHPTLLKRPVILADGVWYQGWTPAVQAAVLGA